MTDYPGNDTDSGGNRAYPEIRDRERGIGATRPQRDFFRRKICKICAGKTAVDCKDPDALRRFTTERGKILPRRITGTCARHQRVVTREVKRARFLALLPFSSK